MGLPHVCSHERLRCQVSTVLLASRSPEVPAVRAVLPGTWTCKTLDLDVLTGMWMKRQNRVLDVVVSKNQREPQKVGHL